LIQILSPKSPKFLSSKANSTKLWYFRLTSAWELLLFAEQGIVSSEQGIGNSEPRRGRRFSPSADAIRFFAGNRFAKIAPTRSDPSVIPGLVRAYGRGADFAV
jgi:hypothetical protein